MHGMHQEGKKKENGSNPFNSTTRLKEEYEGDMLWNGPKIVMVVHNGVPQCVQDKISGKTSYEGPVLKRVMSLKGRLL